MISIKALIDELEEAPLGDVDVAEVAAWIHARITHEVAAAYGPLKIEVTDLIIDVIDAWNEARAEVVDLQAKLAQHKDEGDQLRAFVTVLYECWPDSNEYEGLQELGEKHGILTKEIRYAPCEGDCSCSDAHGSDPNDWDFGFPCWRKPEWMLGGATKP